MYFPTHVLVSLGKIQRIPFMPIAFAACLCFFFSVPSPIRAVDSWRSFFFPMFVLTFHYAYILFAFEIFVGLKNREETLKCIFLVSIFRNLGKFRRFFFCFFGFCVRYFCFFSIENSLIASESICFRSYLK